LHFLTEDWEDFDQKRGTGWANAEVRSYHFIAGLDSTDDENASIIETEESRSRRRKS